MKFELLILAKCSDGCWRKLSLLLVGTELKKEFQDNEMKKTTQNIAKLDF